MAVRNLVGVVTDKNKRITASIMDAQIDGSGNIVPPYSISQSPNRTTGAISIPLTVFGIPVALKIDIEGQPDRSYFAEISSSPSGNINLSDIVIANETPISGLDSDIIAALNAADSPSGANPFLTESQGGGGGSADKPYVTVAPDGIADYPTIADALTAGHLVLSLKSGEAYSGAVSITQDNVLILGNGAEWEERTAGHTFSISGDNVRVEGIKAIGTHNGTTASMTAHSFYSITGDGCQVIQPYFENLKGYDITFNGVDGGRVTRIRSVNGGTDPDDSYRTRYRVYITGDSKKVQVLGGEITGSSQGVGFWNASECVVAWVTGVDNYGWESGGGDVALKRSFFEDFGSTLVNMGNKIVFCNVDGSNSSGIECAQGTSSAVYAHNIIRNTSDDPIGVVGDGSSPTFDIRVFDNDLYGVTCNVINAQNVTFEANRFYDVGGNYTLFYQTGSTGAVAKRNIFRRCGSAGGHQVIRGDAGVGLQAIGNQILECAENTTGILLVGNSEGALVDGNIINATRFGVYTAANARLVNNTITVSGTPGIADRCIAIDGSNVSVFDNLLTSSANFCLSVGEGSLNVRTRDNTMIYTGSQRAVDLRGTLTLMERDRIKVGSGVTHIQLFAAATDVDLNNLILERPDGLQAITDGSTGGASITNVHLVTG